MPKEKKQSNCCKSAKKSKPCEIKGKLEISDKRERRDGPGGN